MVVFVFFMFKNIIIMLPKSHSSQILVLQSNTFLLKSGQLNAFLWGGILFDLVRPPVTAVFPNSPLYYINFDHVKKAVFKVK